MFIEQKSSHRFDNKIVSLGVNLHLQTWSNHFTKGGVHVFPLPIWIADWHSTLVCDEPYGQRHQAKVS